MLLKEFKEFVKDNVFEDIIFPDEVKYWDIPEKEFLGKLTSDNFNDFGEMYYDGKLEKCFLQFEPLDKKVEVFKDLVKSIYRLGISETSIRIGIGFYEFADIICDSIFNLFEDLYSTYKLGVAVLPEMKVGIDKALKELAYVYSLENIISLVELLNRFADACLSYDIKKDNEGIGYFLLDYDGVVKTLATTIKENIENLKDSEITFVDYVLVDEEEGYKVVTVSAYDYIEKQWGYIKEFTGIGIATVKGE